MGRRGVVFHNHYIYNTWSVLLSLFSNDMDRLLGIDKVVYEVVGKPLYLYNVEFMEKPYHINNYEHVVEKKVGDIIVRVYQRGKTYIIDLSYNNNVIRLYGSSSLIHIPSLKDMSVREIAYIVMAELEKQGYRTSPISWRDGFTIFMVEGNNKRIIVWIRRSPISQKALNIFEKIINRYEYTDIIVIKTMGTADYVEAAKTLTPIYGESIEHIVSLIIERLQR